MKDLINLYFYKFLFRTLDVGSKLCPELSNFYPYDFSYKGQKFSSMESLLQGIKFENPEKQKEVFSLVGKKAKFKGKKSKWDKDQTLYFQGKKIKRDSLEYQQFIYGAFLSLYTDNSKARESLIKTKGFKLVHSIGKNDPKQTVLTEQEFCSILTKIRQDLLHS